VWYSDACSVNGEFPILGEAKMSDDRRRSNSRPGRVPRSLTIVRPFARVLRAGEPESVGRIALAASNTPRYAQCGPARNEHVDSDWRALLGAALSAR